MLAKGRARILSATVSRHAGRWSVSLTVEAADLHPAARHPDPPGTSADGGWVGVDRGLSAFVVAATTGGVQVLRVEDPPRPLRGAQSRLRRLSRQVSRKQRGSRNRAEAVARLARGHRRVRNIRQHFVHQVANALVKTHDRLALENLHIAGMLKNRHLSAAIADAGWGELARIIGYKQAWHGGQVTLVDRWFPSTKTCSTCHTMAATAVPLSVRVFHCDSCGHTADRDLNAAVNLAIWAENHAQVRDPEVRGPVINARRGDGADPHHSGAGETSPDEAGTPPPHQPGAKVRTPGKGGVS
jgi:putative transposase